MGELLAAYGYVRVSSIGQGEKDGPLRQRESIQLYADSKGMVIQGFFEDLVSGTVDERPELAKLLVALEENGVRVVIIEKLDRLARDLLVQELIIRDLRRLGVKLISALEGDELASSDPSRKLMRQIFGSIAEYDKSMTVQRLRVARDRLSAKKGKRIEGRKKQYPQWLLDFIWNQRLRGHTYGSIAETVNGWGLTTSTGGCFYPSLIRQILSC